MILSMHNSITKLWEVTCSPYVTHGSSEGDFDVVVVTFEGGVIAAYMQWHCACNTYLVLFTERL